MISNTKTVSERRYEPDSGSVASLQAEIEFWNEVIAGCPRGQSAECVERMHQALALAEFKLAKMHAGLVPGRRPVSRKH